MLQTSNRINNRIRIRIRDSNNREGATVMED